MATSSSHRGDDQATRENVKQLSARAGSSAEDKGKKNSGRANRNPVEEPTVHVHLAAVVCCLITIGSIHLFLTPLLSSGGKFFALIPAWYVTGTGCFFTLSAFLIHMSRRLIRWLRNY